MSDASLIEALKGAASVIENLGFESYDEIVLQLEDLIVMYAVAFANKKINSWRRVEVVRGEIMEDRFIL